MKYYENEASSANWIPRENRILSKTSTFQKSLKIKLKTSRKVDISADSHMLSSIKKQQILLRPMRDYNEFPPLNYFFRVLKNCPRSSLLYTQLWKNKGKHMSLVTEKKNIRKDYLISPTMFRNLLAPLTFLSLVSFIEGDEKFQIDILGPHVNE